MDKWKVALAEFKEENTKVIFCLKKSVNNIENSFTVVTNMIREITDLQKITQAHMEKITEKDAIQTEKVSQLEVRTDKQDVEIKDIKEVKIPAVKEVLAGKLKPLYKGYYGIAGVLLVLLTGLCTTDNPIFSRIIEPILRAFGR